MLTINMNGHEVTGDANEIAQLLQLVETAATTAKPQPEAKAAKAKATPKRKREHSAVLDSKRVDGMVKRATDAAAKAGFEVKTSPQGSWMWLYPCGKSSGKGRADEYKALKLAKGWKYSPKRGAWYRDFANA